MTTQPMTLAESGHESVGQARERKAAPGAPHAAGGFWFAGWLFTIGFVKLVWWKALLALVLWPYFLGAALR